MPLVTQPNLTDPDGVYAALAAAHAGLDAEASARFNTRLMLLLINHIGDADVIHAAICKASEARDPTGQSQGA